MYQNFGTAYCIHLITVRADTFGFPRTLVLKLECTKRHPTKYKATLSLSTVVLQRNSHYIYRQKFV